MPIRHTFSRIAAQARGNPAANLTPQPTNRQLTRTETNMLTIPPDGKTPSRPTVLGEPNGDDPVQVYTTGMFMSLRKGETRWVTGTAVEAGLDSGSLMPIAGLALDDYAEPQEPVPSVFTGQDLRSGGPVGLAELHGVSEDGQRRPGVVEPEASNVDGRLAEMSKSELMKIAQLVGLEGRSGMDKNELYEHLRHHPDVGNHLD